MELHLDAGVCETEILSLASQQGLVASSITEPALNSIGAQLNSLRTTQQRSQINQSL